MRLGMLRGQCCDSFFLISDNIGNFKKSVLLTLTKEISYIIDSWFFLNTSLKPPKILFYNIDPVLSV
jgi:hypothetical protein